MSREKLANGSKATFGGRLAAAIKGKGLKQKEFARRLGTTQISISRYVQGKRMPSAPVIAQMAFLLDVPKTWLMLGDRLGMDRPLAGVAEGEGEAYRESLPGELRAAWRDLNEEERAALLRNAETLRTGDLLSREALIAQSKILGRAGSKRPQKRKDTPGNPSRRGLVG